MKNNYQIKAYYAFLLFFFSFFAQLSAQSAYFQQEVNYQIAVSLDDKKHILTGTIEMAYHNNAPDALDFLYILL